MPKLDLRVHMVATEPYGVTLIRNLRALPQYLRTPILVLTIETSDELKARAKAAGASGWIVKPVHPDSILAAIEKVL
jgi:two-component system chemotaxis response regulator CheY